MILNCQNQKQKVKLLLKLDKEVFSQLSNSIDNFTNQQIHYLINLTNQVNVHKNNNEGLTTITVLLFEIVGILIVSLLVLPINIKSVKTA